jgi:hypothetical protein
VLHLPPRVTPSDGDGSEGKAKMKRAVRVTFAMLLPIVGCSVERDAIHEAADTETDSGSTTELPIDTETDGTTTDAPPPDDGDESVLEPDDALDLTADVDPEAMRCIFWPSYVCCEFPKNCYCIDGIGCGCDPGWIECDAF